MSKREVVENYFKAWLTKDASQLDTIFAEDVCYTESYGPEYRGLRQIKQWFSDWNQLGTVFVWAN